MKKFEKFLRDKYYDIHGEIPEYEFENWLHEMDVEDWLTYGELHAELHAEAVLRGEK